MDDLAISPIDRDDTISLHVDGYHAWCRCVRRLLDWSEGEREDWPQLFASGHTPRDVVRAMMYGNGTGD
jgi:hypothetical protein